MNNTISIISLSKLPDYYEEVIRIIEQELAYSADNSYERDFYPLVNSNNWENCFLIFLNQNLIGHIGIREINFTLKDIKLPILFLGGICIKKEYQGRGLFKLAFTDVLKKFQHQHALHFLWSGHQELYKKFHFYEVGQIFQTGNDNFVNLQSFSHKKLNMLSIDEKEFLLQCYKNSFSQYVKVDRSPQDWENIFQMSSVDVFFQLKDQKKIGYFLINKGQDLQDIIHEIGAIDEFNLSQLIEENEKFKLWLPNPLHHLESSTTLFLGQVRIENFSLLNDWLQKLNIAPLSEQKSLEENTRELFQANNLIFYIPGVDSI